MTQHETIQPCPFCGKLDVSIIDLAGYESHCNHCGASGPFKEGYIQADVDIVTVTDLWNKRASNDRITSLESHNRDLLAVIAAKDEAITKLAAHAIYDDASVNSIAKLRSDAIAIKPGDIELVEVGKTVDYETPIANIVQGKINQGIKSGLTLYTIQTKSNTE